MLQKLENIYLGILRAFVIVVAGILLISAAFYGLGALKGLQSPPEHETFVPRVEHEGEAQDIVDSYADAPDASQSMTESQEAAGQVDDESEDPNLAHYEEVADLIDSFVVEVTDGQLTTDIGFLIDNIRNRAEYYSYQARIDAYAEGLVSYLDEILNDDDVRDRADRTNAFDIVNRALDSYDQTFDRQIEQEEQRRNQERHQHIQDKANATQSLYIAGGTFGAFLFIVFLSIFIKIERNLRTLSQYVSYQNQARQND